MAPPLLFPQPMRLGIVATVIVLAALAAPARADGVYFSESFGGAKVEDELAAHTDGGFRIRWAIGYRARQVALEAWLGLDLAAEADTTSLDPDLMTYGLDAKYAFRLGGPFEVYLRGSMSRMEIDAGALAGHDGRGLGIGTGIQVKGKAPLLALLYPPAAIACLFPNVCKKLGPRATIAAFVDQGYDFYRLHGRGPSIDAEVTRWTLGFAIGSDF